MKRDDLNKIKESTVEELQKKVSDYKAELFNLRFQHATGQLENPIRIREVKRSIAQVKTVLRARELMVSKN